jgi:hypothetical protein
MTDLNRNGVTRNPISRMKSNKPTGVFGAIIFFATLLVITLTAVPYGTVEPWSQMLFEIAVFFLMALWLIEGMARGSWWLAPDQRVLLPLVAVLAIAFIQTLPLMPGAQGRAAISAVPYETKLFILRVAAITGTLLLLIRYTDSRICLY